METKYNTIHELHVTTKLHRDKKMSEQGMEEWTKYYVYRQLQRMNVY
jgi:hypothetical protein